MVGKINLQSIACNLINLIIIKDKIDLTEFYQISAKYENVKVSMKELEQIEKNNDLVAKIIGIRIPDVNKYDQYAENLEKEIKVFFLDLLQTTSSE